MAGDMGRPLNQTREGEGGECCWVPRKAPASMAFAWAHAAKWWPTSAAGWSVCGVNCKGKGRDTVRDRQRKISEGAAFSGMLVGSFCGNGGCCGTQGFAGQQPPVGHQSATMTKTLLGMRTIRCPNAETEEQHVPMLERRYGSRDTRTSTSTSAGASTSAVLALILILSWHWC